jgi:uncharacterized protein
VRSPRPLRVGVAELRRRLGTRKPFHALVALDGLAISSSRVPASGEIDVDLQLESISNGLVVEGTITAPWTGDCRRCLEPVEGSVETQVKEIFERHPTEGETYALGDEEVDLEPMVRDAVLLALPLAPLCRPDCAGPAPDAFPTGPNDDESVDEAHDRAEAARRRDERWSALDELRFEDDDA